MVETPIDSVQLSFGLIIAFLKWLLFRLWTIFAVATSIYGVGLVILVYFFSIDYPTGFESQVTPFDVQLIILYSGGLILLGLLVAWLTLQNGNRPINRRHRYAYQVIATLSVAVLIVLYPDLLISVLDLVFG